MSLLSSHLNKMSEEFEPTASQLLYQLIVVKWAYETNVQSELLNNKVCKC
jgi:hypothetical protein